MHLTDERDPLLAATAELAELGRDEDRAALETLRERLHAGRLRVLVAGEAKRGKSTLVNALLGRAVLPAGVTPLTALATTVRYGRDEGATAVFGDGHAQSFPLSALEDLVTERGNPGNRRGLASVTVAIDAPVLARGAELVETPGTGSVHAHNTAEAEAALGTMDAAVFVLTADPPISASERELMARVAELSVTLFVVLNKADYLAGYRASAGSPAVPGPGGAASATGPGGPDRAAGGCGEFAEALEFTTRVAGQAAGRTVRVYPLSARAALAGGGDPGFTALAADFTAHLDQGRGGDLRLSAAAHARRIAGSLRDEAVLARHAARMRTGSEAERMKAFAARLAAVGARRQDAADLARAESARLLADLNAAAERAAGDNAGRVDRQMETLLTGDLAAAKPDEIERTGRARLATLASRRPSGGASSRQSTRSRSGPVHYETEVAPLFQRYLYRPVIRAVEWLADAVQPLQSGDVNLYLFYVFLVILVAYLLGAL